MMKYRVLEDCLIIDGTAIINDYLTLESFNYLPRIKIENGSHVAYSKIPNEMIFIITQYNMLVPKERGVIA